MPCRIGPTTAARSRPHCRLPGFDFASLLCECRAPSEPEQDAFGAHWHLGSARVGSAAPGCPTQATRRTGPARCLPGWHARAPTPGPTAAIGLPLPHFLLRSRSAASIAPDGEGLLT